MREAVEEFLPQVFATAKRMLRNEADAEEVAQETFLRIWNSVGTCGPAGKRNAGELSRVYPVRHVDVRKIQPK